MKKVLIFLSQQSCSFWFSNGFSRHPNILFFIWPCLSPLLGNIFCSWNDYDRWSIKQLRATTLNIKAHIFTHCPNNVKWSPAVAILEWAGASGPWSWSREFSVERDWAATSSTEQQCLFIIFIGYLFECHNAMLSRCTFLRSHCSVACMIESSLAAGHLLVCATERCNRH